MSNRRTFPQRGTTVALGLVLLLGPARQGVGQPTPEFTAFPFPDTYTLWGGSPAIVTGPDGALWFSDWYRIGRITVDGEVTFHGLPPDGTDPTTSRGIVGMAVGADGAVWFTESERGRIGRITMQGQVTEFILSDGQHPNRIAAGPDGALWYTEWRDRVGRITTEGLVTEYTLPPCGPTCSPHPHAITAGRDGALWFTNLGDNSIWRITTAGELTMVGRFVVQVGDITDGPDAALWFTGPDTAGPDDHIGRITSDGNIEAHPLPIYPRPTFNGYNNIAPLSITVGPDAALWFTSYRLNIIGRMTTAGELSFHSLPGDPPTTDVLVYRAITRGPDNALWITTRGAIVRAVLPDVPLTVAIDVKPGSCRNPFNPASRGVLPVAVLGTANFFAESIAAETVRLNGVAAQSWSLEDVAGVASDCKRTAPDGYPDLVLKFPSRAIAASIGATRGGTAPVSLTGALEERYGGTPLAGADSVTLVGHR